MDVHRQWKLYFENRRDLIASIRLEIVSCKGETRTISLGQNTLRKIHCVRNSL